MGLEEIKRGLSDELVALDEKVAGLRSQLEAVTSDRDRVKKALDVLTPRDQRPKPSNKPHKFSDVRLNDAYDALPTTAEFTSRVGALHIRQHLSVAESTAGEMIRQLRDRGDLRLVRKDGLSHVYARATS